VARDSSDLYRVARTVLGCGGVVRSVTAMPMVEVVPLRREPLLRETAGEGGVESA
jgi:hypothetical protein